MKKDFSVYLRTKGNMYCDDTKTFPLDRIRPGKYEAAKGTGNSY